MVFRVTYAPEAEAQLVALYRYIAREASSDIAKRYTDAIVERCEKLDSFPRRGTPRDDIRPGLRTVSFRRNVKIAYKVNEDDVAILGIFFGGQDFETILKDNIDN